MILLLGASGCVGQVFASELRRRGYCVIPLTRRAIDYSNFDLLFNYVRKMQPEFLINTAGRTGEFDVDVCEQTRLETLAANTLLPQTIARVCLMTNTPWGHVSSGSIYSGAKMVDNGQIGRRLNHLELRCLMAEHPERICGFTELDEPNFSFHCPPCNFYSGTKALAERVIRGVGQSYIWRPGVLFNERKESRNFLWRIQQSGKIHDSVNSMSHVEDFVRACLSLWERQAPFGIYNVTNLGAVTTRQAVAMIQRILKSNRRFEFWKDDNEFYCSGAKAPRSSCILDDSKLLAAGVKMRPAEEALEDSLHHWHSSAMPAEMVCH